MDGSELPSHGSKKKKRNETMRMKQNNSIERRGQKLKVVASSVCSQSQVFVRKNKRRFVFIRFLGTRTRRFQKQQRDHSSNRNRQCYTRGSLELFKPARRHRASRVDLPSDRQNSH